MLDILIEELLTAGIVHLLSRRDLQVPGLHKGQKKSSEKTPENTLPLKEEWDGQQ